MTKTTPEVQQLIELREHHRREAQRCDDAIRLLLDVGKMLKRANKVVGHVRERATADASIRLGPAKSKRGTSTSAAARYSRKVREDTKAGTRPIDVVRGLFREVGDAVVSFEQLLPQTRFVERDFKGGPGNAKLGSNGNARRVLGLTLSQLVKTRELKRTADGWVVRKLRPDVSVNGTGASA